MSIGTQEQDTFGCYTVLKDKAGESIRLGEGPWGPAYKAFHADLCCYAALRLVPQNAFSGGDSRDRFAREVRLAARVRHPSLASVFPLGSFENAWLYATEFCDGEAVSALLVRDGSLPIRVALTITSQIAAALDAACAAGLFHRNITTGNILFMREDDEISTRLLDLALPAQETGAEPDESSGVHSLGVLLHGMLGGEADRALRLKEIFARTLCDDPDKRVRTFAELRGFLEAALFEGARPPLVPSPRVVKAVAAPPPKETPKPAPKAKAPSAGALTIPAALLQAAQAGTVLRLKPVGGEKGSPVIVCARDHFRIGRSAAASDLVARFLPRSPENDAKTKLLSKIHVVAKCEDGQLLLHDGDGLRPSANGSMFDQRALSAETPLVFENRGELRLANAYSIKVIPLRSEGGGPVISNLGDWTGPTQETPAPVSGAVLFLPDVPGETGVGLWLFSVAPFAGNLNFALPAGELGMGALRYHRGCFWLERRSGAPILIDNTGLDSGGIAPLITGQILGIGDFKYAVQIG